MEEQQQKKLMIWEVQEQNRFRHFKEGETNILKDKPLSMKSSVVEEEALLQVTEQQQSTSCYTFSQRGSFLKIESCFTWLKQQPGTSSHTFSAEFAPSTGSSLRTDTIEKFLIN